MTKRAALPMKVCVQWASNGSPANAAARMAAAGASRRTLQPAIGEPDQEPEGDENAEKSHGSDLFQQIVDIEGGAAPEVHRMRLQEDLRRPSPLIVQQSEELPFRIELRGGAKLGQHLASDAVDAHAGPLRALRYCPDRRLAEGAPSCAAPSGERH